MGITIDASDLRRLSQELMDLGFPPDARRRILRFAGAEIQADIQRNISSRKENEDGSQWSNWRSEAYRRRQNRRGRRERQNILLDTGTLRNSISWDADDDEMIVGTNVDYAEALHFGTSNSEPREFMFISEEAGENILDFIEERIFEA